jgi:UDP-2-acetamido-2-deoxy-ribo-hexuluronate aminotransferase
MHDIKMVDLQGQYLKIKNEIDQAMQQVLDSTAFIQGTQVSEFAGSLSEFLGGAQTVPCGNGTDALQIAMMALELKPGDEVILPVHTYVATAEVIALLQLEPVFVDVNPDTFTIDVKTIEPKITGKTRAIVPVHLYGQCAEMETILSLAKKFNLHVIEDAAQALGSVYSFSNKSVKHAGTMGTIGTTSFFPSKNLGCFGDGGAIFTNDLALAEKIRMIANHGQRIKYHHDIIGLNSRLDTLQAAVLKVKLNYLDDYTRARNRVADQYDLLLSSLGFLTIPSRSKNSTHVFHQYTLRVEKGRDQLKKHLENHGIPTMIYYPVPLHLQKAYRKEKYPEGSFPVTEKLSKTVLSLPIHTEMTEDQVQYIASVIADF